MSILPKTDFGGRTQGGSWTRRLFRSNCNAVRSISWYLPQAWNLQELQKCGQIQKAILQLMLCQGTWMRVDKSNADDLSKQRPSSKFATALHFLKYCNSNPSAQCLVPVWDEVVLQVLAKDISTACRSPNCLLSWLALPTHKGNHSQHNQSRNTLRQLCYPSWDSTVGVVCHMQAAKYFLQCRMAVKLQFSLYVVQFWTDLQLFPPHVQSFSQIFTTRCIWSWLWIFQGALGILRKSGMDLAHHMGGEFCQPRLG